MQQAAAPRRPALTPSQLADVLNELAPLPLANDAAVLLISRVVSGEAETDPDAAALEVDMAGQVLQMTEAPQAVAGRAFAAVLPLRASPSLLCMLASTAGRHMGVGSGLEAIVTHRPERWLLAVAAQAMLGDGSTPVSAAVKVRAALFGGLASAGTVRRLVLPVSAEWAREGIEMPPLSARELNAAMGQLEMAERMGEGARLPAALFESAVVSMGILQAVRDELLRRDVVPYGVKYSPRSFLRLLAMLGYTLQPAALLGYTSQPAALLGYASQPTLLGYRDPAREPAAVPMPPPRTLYELLVGLPERETASLADVNLLHWAVEMGSDMLQAVLGFGRVGVGEMATAIVHQWRSSERGFARPYLADLAAALHRTHRRALDVAIRKEMVLFVRLDDKRCARLLRYGMMDGWTEDLDLASNASEMGFSDLQAPFVWFSDLSAREWMLVLHAARPGRQMPSFALRRMPYWLLLRDMFRRSGRGSREAGSLIPCRTGSISRIARLPRLPLRAVTLILAMGWPELLPCVKACAGEKSHLQ